MSKPFCVAKRETMPRIGVVSSRLQAEGVEQIGAAGGFAGEIVGGVVGGEVGVGCRVPLRVVDTVEDAAQIGGAGAQHGVELLAELRGFESPRRICG